MESWIACTDVDVASAFMTMGVVMKPVVQVRADSGKEYVTMYLSTTSVTMPEINVGHLMKALMSGELQKLDEVAYIRFASVYRRFQDLNEFREEIDRLAREPIKK